MAVTPLIAQAIEEMAFDFSGFDKAMKVFGSFFIYLLVFPSQSP